MRSLVDKKLFWAKHFNSLTLHFVLPDFFKCYVNILPFMTRRIHNSSVIKIGKHVYKAQCSVLILGDVISQFTSMPRNGLPIRGISLRW